MAVLLINKDLTEGISDQLQLSAGCCNSWFSYRDPAVGARVPSQPVVVVGEMTVWIVSHKPWCAGHLLMETNETKTRMRNELKRGKHRNEKWSAYGMQKQPEFKTSNDVLSLSFSFTEEIKSFTRRPVCVCSVLLAGFWGVCFETSNRLQCFQFLGLCHAHSVMLTTRWHAMSE